MKRFKTIILASFLAVFTIGGVSYAGTKDYHPESYGDMQIDCYISCNKDTGVAKTKGNVMGTYNRAAIIIYNLSGKALGNNTNYAHIVPAVASQTSKNKVYSAHSYHSLLYTLDDTHVYPLYEQAVLNEDRY